MKKVIFLDRDGTLNVDHGYVHEIEQWEWVPGALEAMNVFQEAGYALAVVTNQSGIGHGKYTHDHVAKLHEHMLSDMKKAGIKNVAIAYCHHHREDPTCLCRKPKTGMAETIEQAMGPIDYTNSWMIGDKEADVGFGKAKGMKTVLIKSRYWQEQDLTEKPDLVVDSLLEAAQYIVRNKANEANAATQSSH